MKTPFFCLYFPTDEVKIQYIGASNQPKRKKVPKKKAVILQQNVP